MTPFSVYLLTRCQSATDRSLYFTKELKNATREAGDSLRLKCEVDGSIPATSIQWFKNDGPVIEEQSRVILSIHFHCKLFFGDMMSHRLT
jgi:Immunoglobulin I-set domain